MKDVKLKLVEANERDRLYACPAESVNEESPYIGYMRFDFGHGNEFWHTWFDGNNILKTVIFQKKFQEVVDFMRQNKILSTFDAMLDICKKSEWARIDTNVYGFKIIENNYIYYLRCSIEKHDYSYIFCYQ